MEEKKELLRLIGWDEKLIEKAFEVPHYSFPCEPVPGTKSYIFPQSRDYSTFILGSDSDHQSTCETAPTRP